MWNVLFRPKVGRPMTIFRPSLNLSDEDEVLHIKKVIKIRHVPFSDWYVCTAESGKLYDVLFSKKANKLLKEYLT